MIVLMVGLGATAFGRRFRLYSIVTILVLVVFGSLAGLNGPQTAANLPTPWFGVQERINIFGYLLWVVVLSIGIWCAQGEQRSQHGLGAPGSTPAARRLTSGVRG